MSETFKPGDRVRCKLDDASNHVLTDGKDYTVECVLGKYLKVSGLEGAFSRTRFTLVERPRIIAPPAKTYSDGLAEGKAALERVRAEVEKKMERPRWEHEQEGWRRALDLINAEIARARTEGATMTLDELEKLAMAATPGPWESDTTPGIGDCRFDAYAVTDDQDGRICDTLNSEVFLLEEADEHGVTRWDERGRKNLAYIAACSPNNILALIASHRALKEALNKIADLAYSEGDEPLDDAIRIANTTLSRLEAPEQSK